VRVRKQLEPEGAGKLVEVSLTQPQFAYTGGESGNIWNMDAWKIFRLTSADLDNGSYGSLLNEAQSEFVGDVRLQATVARLDGRVALVLRQGRQQGARLALAADGWALEGLDGLAGDKPLAAGREPVVGKAISFAHIDNQLVVTIGASEVARVDVPPADPNLQRLQLSLAGSGSIDLAEARIQRDVHYTSNWVLRNAADERKRYEDELRQNQGDLARDTSMRNLRDIDKVRRQFDPRHKDGGNEALACSPETAVTAPAGAYLMLGDNSPTSWDSRAWGFVPAVNLRGRAIAVVLPPTRWRVVR
jgi:hypothetical protein